MIVYVLLEPEQTVAFPVIDPGVAGVGFTTIAFVCAAEVPHVLAAVTVIVPLAAFDVALMLVVVDAPVHPPGMVQL